MDYLKKCNFNWLHCICNCNYLLVSWLNWMVDLCVCVCGEQTEFPLRHNSFGQNPTHWMDYSDRTPLYKIQILIFYFKSFVTEAIVFLILVFVLTCLNTMRKQIRLPRALIQDGDRSVPLQNYFSYFYSKSVFKPRNLVNLN